MKFIAINIGSSIKLRRYSKTINLLSKEHKLKFIQKNRRQISKNPKSRKEPLDAPIKFVQYNDGEIANAFINEIEILVNKYGNKSILVLGRHSFDIHDLIALTPKSRVKYFEGTGINPITS